MGLINLPSVDDIMQIKDPNRRTEALIELVGRLMKDLRELNGYMNSKNIFEVGGWRVTGDKLSSAPGVYPYMELNPKDKFFAAYKDAEHFLQILTSTSGTSVPSILFRDSSLPKVATIYFDPESDGLAITAQGDINIGATGGVVKIDGVDLITSKADAFTGYTGSVSTGTQTLNFSNGVLVSVT